MKISLKIIMAMLLLVLSSLSVSAVDDTNLTNGCVMWFVFSNTSANMNGATIKDWSGRANGTMANLNCPSGAGYCNLSQDNSAVTFTGAVLTNQTGFVNSRQTGSLVNTEIMTKDNSGSNFLLIWGATAPRELNTYGGAYTKSSAIVGNVTSRMVVNKYGAYVNYFVNGTNVSVDVDGSTGAITTAQIGRTNTATATGIYYLVALWNRSLDSGEIAYLETKTSSDFTYNPYQPQNVTASFVAPTPPDNAHNNTQVTLNVTCSNNTGTTYSLWFDSVDGSTPIFVNSATSSWETNVTTQTHYYYKGACSNGGLTSINTTVLNWYYDTDSPVITINTSYNEFNKGNYSLRNQYDNDLNISLLLTDNIGLYALEINITDSLGVVKYNITNTSLSGTSILYNQNINVSSWGTGVYYIKLSLSDTHTATAINNYEVAKDYKSLVFDTAEGNNIKISSADSISTTYEKKVDSYEFGFVYDEKDLSPSKTFIVENLKGGKVKYLPESRYKAHFVIFDDKTFNGNWVDFEGLEGKPEVFCESESRCSVTFNDIKEDSIIFKSIGGLNIIHEYYSWYRGRYSFIDTNVLAGNPVTIGLNISNDTSMSFVNISLNHNGTSYNSTSILNISGSNYTYFYIAVNSPALNSTINYTWLLTDLQNDLNITILNLSDGYETYAWNMDLCSPSCNYTTLKFNMYYEQIPTTIFNMSLELEIKIWASNYSQSKDLNFSLTGNNEYYLCLYSNQSLNMNLYAKDSIEGGLTHRYFIYNQTINDTLTSISLYNFNDTTSTALLRITARDSDTYQYYPETIGWLERLYIGEGVWRVVQMDRSDDYGLLIYDVVEKSQDYRLKFYDTENNLLKTSDVLRFSCDSGVCELVSLISPTGSDTTEAELEVNYTYNNATDILNVGWLDDTGEVTSVRMYVSKQTITGSLMIFNVTQNGSSGNYTFNLSGITGMVLLSVHKTASPESDAVSYWISLVENKLGDILGGDEGAFWSFIMLVVVVMLGIISPVACIILAVVGLIALYSLGIFSGLTLVVVIVAGVMAIALGVKIRR